MARKTITALIDDVDGEYADQTISFALDGLTYEIDLSNENAIQLREDIEKWAKKSRRAGGRRHRGTGPFSSLE